MRYAAPVQSTPSPTTAAQTHAPGTAAGGQNGSASAMKSVAPHMLPWALLNGSIGSAADFRYVPATPYQTVEASAAATAGTQSSVFVVIPPCTRSATPATPSASPAAR